MRLDWRQSREQGAHSRKPNPRRTLEKHENRGPEKGTPQKVAKENAAVYARKKGRGLSF